MGEDNISYYAIAIGREQKITEDYLEYKRLTNGYSGAKGKKCHTFEEAEKYIQDITSIIQNKVLNEFESEQKLIPAFFNSNNKVKTLKTEMYISSNRLEKTDKEYCSIVDNVVNTVTKESITVSTIISTYAELDLIKDEEKSIKSGDSKLINYFNHLTNDEFLDADKQLMYIQCLMHNLLILKDAGITSVNLFTDSNYILYLLKNNIFRDTVAIGYKIKNEDEIKMLYEICKCFEYVFISYYSGNIMPNKLRYTMDKSRQINLDTLSPLTEDKDIQG